MRGSANVRLGFLRLWVVLSAIWVVASIVLVGPGALEDMRREEFLHRLHALTPPKAGLPCQIAEGAGPAIEWEKVSKLLPGDQLLCVAELEAIRALSPNYMAATEQVLLEKLDQRTRTWSQWPIGVATAVVLSPPLLALVLGLALAWVAAGFRATPGKRAT